MSLYSELNEDLIDAFEDLDEAVIDFTISYVSRGTYDAASQMRINTRTVSGSWEGVQTNFSERDIKDFPIGKTVISVIAISSQAPFTINTKENYTITIDNQEYLVKRIKKDPINATYTFLGIEK